MTTVCFVANHGGPAEHFALYAEALTNQGCAVKVYANPTAMLKFQALPAGPVYSILGLPSTANELEVISRACFDASILITDVGHEISLKAQQAFATFAPKVMRLAYYDNPEPFVPGGYSEVASKVMKASQGVLFPNDKLAVIPILEAPGRPVDFGSLKRMGIGFYPTRDAMQIKSRRVQEHDKLKEKILIETGQTNLRQNLYVYFGGNNEVYFNEAFPAFLHYLFLAMELFSEGLKNAVILLQQHPGAKSVKGNLDKEMLDLWNIKNAENPYKPKILVSTYSSGDVQVAADGIFYYQTSMGPQFILANIPTLQIAHETYVDFLVQHSFVESATNVFNLMIFLTNMSKKAKSWNTDDILDLLGTKDWPTRLQNILQDFLPKPLAPPAPPLPEPLPQIAPLIPSPRTITPLKPQTFTRSHLLAATALLISIIALFLLTAKQKPSP